MGQNRWLFYIHCRFIFYIAFYFYKLWSEVIFYSPPDCITTRIKKMMHFEVRQFGGNCNTKFNSHAWGRAPRRPRDFKFVFRMFLVDRFLRTKIVIPVNKSFTTYVLFRKNESGRLGARPQACASNYPPSVRVNIVLLRHFVNWPLQKFPRVKNP